MNKLILSLVIISAIAFTQCEDGSVSSDSSGKGGSLARFAVKGNYLYTVDENNLNTYNITTPQTPALLNTKPAGFEIETIYPYKNSLFLGSRVGMYIYDISTPSSPNLLSEFSHVRSCDPVVVDDNYAYVTLRSENSTCGSFTNELKIVDISNQEYPFEVTRYTLTNPKGLGIDSSTLFICDAGLKVYNVSNVNDINLVTQISNIEANDVISNNGNLIVTGDNGIMQYSYSGGSLTLLSTINIEN